MAIDIVLEPPMQRAELTRLDLAWYLRVPRDGSGIELGAQNVADGVALEAAADQPGVPMHVLEASVTIVRRGNADVTLHGRAKGLRQILRAQRALQKLQLEI